MSDDPNCGRLVAGELVVETRTYDLQGRLEVDFCNRRDGWAVFGLVSPEPNPAELASLFSQLAAACARIPQRVAASTWRPSEMNYVKHHISISFCFLERPEFVLREAAQQQLQEHLRKELGTKLLEYHLQHRVDGDMAPLQR